MARVLATDVHVTDEKNEVTILKAGESVPKKFEKHVTNPNAYIDVEEEKPDKGSSSGDGTYGSLTPTKLKALLKKRELPQDGEKAELIARLEADDAEQESEDDGSENSDDDEENG